MVTENIVGKPAHTSEAFHSIAYVKRTVRALSFGDEVCALEHTRIDWHDGDDD